MVSARLESDLRFKQQCPASRLMDELIREDFTRGGGSSRLGMLAMALARL